MKNANPIGLSAESCSLDHFLLRTLFFSKYQLSDLSVFICLNEDDNATGTGLMQGSTELNTGQEHHCLM